MSDLYKFGYTLDETIKTMRDVIDTGNHDRMFLDTYYWLKMLSEYREIGTVEECREAVEKQKVKKHGTGGHANAAGDLISRKSLLECAEYDDKGRLVIPYRKVENAPTAFDKEKVIEELYRYTAEECELHECGIRSEYCNVCMAKKAIEIVEKGRIE